MMFWFLLQPFISFFKAVTRVDSNSNDSSFNSKQQLDSKWYACCQFLQSDSLMRTWITSQNSGNILFFTCNRTTFSWEMKLYSEHFSCDFDFEVTAVTIEICNDFYSSVCPLHSLFQLSTITLMWYLPRRIDLQTSLPFSNDMRVFSRKMLNAFDFYHLHSDFLLLTTIPITIPQPAMTRSMHSSLGSAGNMIVTKMRGRFSDGSINSSNSSGNSSNNSNKLSSLGWVTVYFYVQYSEQFLWKYCLIFIQMAWVS